MIRMNRRLFAASLLTGAVLTATGLTTTGLHAEEPRQIRHLAGTTEVSGKPLKIVALEFSFVEALDMLGVMPAGIADDNQPARIGQLLGREIEYASVGTRLEPNLELVSALAPDLIVADQTRHAAIYSQLSAIAPTIILNSWEGDYDTLKGSFLTISDAIGESGKGKDLLAAHAARMEGFAKQIPDGEDRHFLLAVATPDSMSLHTSSSFVGTVLAAIGLRPAVEAAKSVESGAGLERMIAVGPDVLLVATDPGGTVLNQWQDNAAWQSIPAVQNHMIFEIDRNQFSRFRGLHIAELIAAEVLGKVYGKS